MRQLKIDFLKMFFTQKELIDLLDYVKKDDTLCLELRGDFISIYYRGCSLYKITYKGNSFVTVKFDDEYLVDKNLAKNIKGVSQFNNIPINKIIDIIPLLKQQIDFYFMVKSSFEREFQQEIVRENNFSNDEISNATDYFILDIESTFKETSGTDARFDMIAIEWKSETVDRKNLSPKKLTVVEVKYGDSAVDGNAGIEKHINDFIALKNNKQALQMLCRDLEIVIKQKCALGLLKGYVHFKEIGAQYRVENGMALSGDNEIASDKFNIHIKDDDLEMLFIFINHDPGKIKIARELNKIIIQNKNNVKYLKCLNNIFVAVSSEMGYGLYRYTKDRNQDRYYTLKEYCDIAKRDSRYC